MTFKTRKGSHEVGETKAYNINQSISSFRKILPILDKKGQNINGSKGISSILKGPNHF